MPPAFARVDYIRNSRRNFLILTNAIEFYEHRRRAQTRMCCTDAVRVFNSVNFLERASLQTNGYSEFTRSKARSRKFAEKRETLLSVRMSRESFTERNGDCACIIRALRFTENRDYYHMCVCYREHCLRPLVIGIRLASYATSDTRRCVSREQRRSRALVLRAISIAPSCVNEHSEIRRTSASIERGSRWTFRETDARVPAPRKICITRLTS